MTPSALASTGLHRGLRPLASLLRRNLAWRLLAPGIFLVLAAGALLGLWRVSDIEQEQRLLALGLGKFVERYFEDASRTLETLAVLTQAQSFRAESVQTVLERGAFERLLLLDAQGWVLEAAPAPHAIANYSSLLESMSDASRMGWRLSPPHYSPASGHMTVSLAALTPGGDTLVGDIRLLSLQNYVMDVVEQRTGRLIIITDRFGNVLAHPEERLVREQANLGHEEAMARALASPEGWTGVARLAGSSYLVSATTLPALGWVVLVADEALPRFMPLVTAVGGFMAVLVTLLGVVVWRLNRSLDDAVAKPIRAFTAMAASLEEGVQTETGKAAQATLEASPVRELAILKERLLGMAAAITQRETALQESERLLRILYENAPVGIFRSTPEGRYLSANRQMATLYGYDSPVQLLTQVHSIAQQVYCNPADRDILLAELRERGAVIDREVCRLTRHGEVIWTSTNMRAHYEDDEIVYFDGFVTDISERKRAEEAMRRQRDLLDTLFENIQSGIVVLDADGRFLLVNRGFEELTGYTVEDTPDVLAWMERAYPDPAVRERILQDWRASAPHGRTEREYIIQCKDGSLKHVQFQTSPLSDGRVVTAMADITERKRAEAALAEMNQELERMVQERTAELERKAEELERANEQLRELDEMKSTLLSSVSHELRTPLTSVLGFAKLIRKDFEADFAPLLELMRRNGDAVEEEAISRRAQRISRNIDIIVSEGERLTRLINDLLDLNRIESGRMQWNDRPVNLAEVLANAGEFSQNFFADRPDLTFVLDIDEDMPTLMLDPDRIHQVVLNLLQNAAKHTRAGSVTLEGRRTPEGGAMIRVRDTGEGIPPQDLERVFERFHRVANGDTVLAHTQGAGLGLAICKQIVEHYGGTITVDSDLAVGSTFTVTAPPDSGAPAEG